MSAESQGCTTATKLESARVKKEQLELSVNGQTTAEGRVQLQHRMQPTRITSSAQPPPPPPPPVPSLANGFHSNLLQDILKSSKFNSLTHHTPAAKHEKIRLMLEDSISEESRSHVQEIFSQVEQLKIEEKLLLYLKLPISLTNPNGAVDPLRQPLNPLGNRYEIHQTIMWIKTHLEEDPEVSLPKQEVYDEYNIFCSKNSMKPLSTADFGKVMKQVYPRVRPRRLGTRGNSRYCYAGMRKRIKLDPPKLPTTSGIEADEDSEHNITEEMLGAASTLIREWAETLLDVKFPTLCALGKYLVNNLCVDSRSLAAVCILSASSEPQSVTSKGNSAGLPVIPVSGKIGKLREAQLQLQRKLQQREHTRDQKYRHLDSVLQNQNKEKAGDNNSEIIVGGSKKGKKGKTSVSHLAQGTNTTNTLNKINVSAVISAGRQKKFLKSNNQSCSISLQSNCDNLVVQSIQDNEQNNSASRLRTSESAISPKEAKSKYTRKRTSVNVVAQASESSPEKQSKLLDTQNSLENITDSTTPSCRPPTSTQQSAKISVILANNPKSAKSNKTISEAVATLVNQPLKSCDKKSSLCSNDYSESNSYQNGSDLNNKRNVLSENQINLSQKNSSSDVNEKLGSIDSDALNDYLNGGNNSQEQEEELLQYFQQSNSSSSDAEINGIVTETEQTSRQDKVSQLRIILQENLKDSVLPINKTRLKTIPVEKQSAMQKHNLILPTLLNHNNTVNTRRRVSFETNIIEHTQDNGNTNTLGHNTVPQSPNTRRRIFNFTPISPGPPSPINGRASKSSSANVSPFVSPRNTPVPRSRSNLQGSVRSRGSQKTLARSISCNVPCSGNKNDIFIVPTSGSELIKQIHSPLITVNNKASQVPQLVQVVQDRLDKPENLPCAPFLTDLATQEPQLLINYPSQENLQEIKNIHQKHQPTDQEISDLLQSEKQQYAKEQLFYRSQSVPLHRMVNPALLSPVSIHHVTPTFLSHSFNPSTNSSIAPTPVPSELNDFGPIGPCDGSNYLLDVDPLVPDQQFLIEDKEMIPENLSNIFDILADGDAAIVTEETANKNQTLNSNAIILDALPNTGINESMLLADSTVLLDNWTNASNNLAHRNPINSEINNAPKLIHSRSYPNTPLPLPNSTFTVQYPEDGNGSKSYPTTPLHNLQHQENYTESNEPMLFNPTLNPVNLHNRTTNVINACSTSVECNVAEFLERDLPNDETEDLGSLGNFEGLQDVDTLSPLFTEVVESNH